jgi:(p)ppGpp synthase/HD superfamily hydrolase
MDFSPPTLEMPVAKLEDAIALALKVHRGQKDKAGQPYILHPLRVMMRLDTEDERMAAVLHDALEDGEVTAADLRKAGFPKNVVDAVDRLTHRKGQETYFEYLERAASHRLARKVKMADLEDNMDVRRLNKVGPDEARRLAKYRKAWGLIRQWR